MEDKIKNWIGDGYGYGDGDGDGYGYGDGSGYGYGSGSGDGYGYGDGLKSINGMCINIIDGIKTIITHLRGDIAKGFIVNNELTLTPCFVVKKGYLFAHGETLRQANDSLKGKILLSSSVDERVDAFLLEFNLTDKYSVNLFSDWHFKLTGSCKTGRNSFLINNGINLDDTFTVSEFIEKIKNEYGGEVIRNLSERISNI